MLLVGELEGQRLAARGGGLGAVGGGGGVRVGVDLDRVGLQVEDDVLRDAGCGIGGEFGFLVAGEGTVGGFDDAGDVGGCGEGWRCSPPPQVVPTPSSVGSFFQLPTPNFFPRGTMPP